MDSPVFMILLLNDLMLLKQENLSVHEETEIKIIIDFSAAIR